MSDRRETERALVLDRTSAEQSELGAYHPVSDALVLAALDRAQRHNPHGYDEGVIWAALAEHLGFVHSAATTKKLRPQVHRLIAGELVGRRKVRGRALWRLTDAGRKRLTRARREREDLRLPEAPQHRVWRMAQSAAAERIDGLREQLRDTLREAGALLQGEGRDTSDAWFALRGRMTRHSEWLASATYCLREWPEPDDARADVDSSDYGEHRRSFYSWRASDTHGASQ
jgi:hypothetical protein